MQFSSTDSPKSIPDVIAEFVARWPLALSAGCAVVAVSFASAYTKKFEKLAHVDIEQGDKLKTSKRRSRIRAFTSKSAPKSVDVVVIGTGTGGLACAVALAKRGWKVLMLEQHDKPGGCTHTYIKEGYEFDTGLHYVGGSVWDKTKGGRVLMDFVTDGGVAWERTGDITDVSIVGEQSMDMRSGREKVRQDLQSMFPKEVAVIDAYFEAVKSCQSLGGLYFAHKILPWWACKMLNNSMRKKYVTEYASKTTLEVLQSLGASKPLIARLSYHWGNYGLPPSKSSFAVHCMVVEHYLDGAAYPVGGSSVIADEAIQTLEKYGGSVLVNAPVESILINSRGIAVGVRVARAGGIDVLAPIVVSAAGAVATFTKLLPEAYQPPQIVESIRNLPVAQSCAHIALSVGMNASSKELQLPGANYWIAPSEDADANRETWYNCGGSCEKISSTPFPAVFITFPSAKDPSWDSRYPGKSTCHMIAEAPYEWFHRWRETRLGHRGEEYLELKAVLTEKLLSVLYKHFPQCEAKADVIDLGTPLTTEHYIGAVQGASYGMNQTPERFSAEWLRMETPVPGLYLAGQDVVSGGVMGALCGGYLTAIAVDKSILWSQYSVVASL